MLDRDVALDALRSGELEVTGRLLASSNNAMFGTVTRRCPEPGSDLVVACVYKPIRGERPLDDFPDATLSRREVAAHVVSEASGWDIVPPTVLRDGPFGPGMVQLWLEPDDDADPWTLVEQADARLRPIAVFDAVVNNADRKVGHLLPVDGHVYGVDHGICFAVEPKLRTVLWSWRGRRLADTELEVVAHLRDALRLDLGEALRELISGPEVEATVERADDLLRTGRFPLPDPERPAIPWPPF